MYFWAKAHDVSSLLAAQDCGAGMPWVNTIAADRSGHVLYADHSVVPNVPDDLVQQCLTPTGILLKAQAVVTEAFKDQRQLGLSQQRVGLARFQRSRLTEEIGDTVALLRDERIDRYI